VGGQPGVTLELYGGNKNWRKELNMENIDYKNLGV
jgi:hypothetical protein